MRAEFIKLAAPGMLTEINESIVSDVITFIVLHSCARMPDLSEKLNHFVLHKQVDQGVA
jgi:hypothetical protein